MSEQSNQQSNEPQEPIDPDPGQSGNADLGAFPAWYMAIFSRPDEVFGDKSAGQKLFGLISMAIVIVLIALGSFVQRVGLTTTSGVRLSWLINGIKFGLSFAIPMVVLLFALKWYSDRQNSGHGLDFYIGKFGAAMALPSVLLAIAIPLNLLSITMHSWFRSSGLFFIYIAVFMMSYLYAAPHQIKPAVLFSLGFYFAYRLIWLLM
jgi:hypothetical protein